MFETEETTPEPDQDPPSTPSEPPATETEIAELDNYFEKGLRSPDEDERH
jgi:hypothetical protein